MAWSRLGCVYHRSLLGNWVSVTTHQRESWKDLGPSGVNLDAVDWPLSPLPDLHEGVALVLELRCRGLTQYDNAEMFGVDCTTVTRDWTFGKAWLQAELENLPGENQLARKATMRPESV